LRVGVDLIVDFNSRVVVRVDLIDDFDFNLGLNVNIKLESGLDVLTLNCNYAFTLILN